LKFLEHMKSTFGSNKVKLVWIFFNNSQRILFIGLAQKWPAHRTRPHPPRALPCLHTWQRVDCRRVGSFLPAISPTPPVPVAASPSLVIQCPRWLAGVRRNQAEVHWESPLLPPFVEHPTLYKSSFDQWANHLPPVPWVTLKPTKVTGDSRSIIVGVPPHQPIPLPHCRHASTVSLPPPLLARNTPRAPQVPRTPARPHLPHQSADAQAACTVIAHGVMRAHSVLGRLAVWPWARPPKWVAAPSAVPIGPEASPPTEILFRFLLVI
jgi:hypothetical protein